MFLALIRMWLITESLARLSVCLRLSVANVVGSTVGGRSGRGVTYLAQHVLFILFFNNSVKHQPTLIVFRTRHPEETRHRKVINLPISSKKNFAALLWELWKVTFQ